MLSLGESFQVVVVHAVLFRVAFGIEPVIFLRMSSVTGAANCADLCGELSLPASAFSCVALHTTVHVHLQADSPERSHPLPLNRTSPLGALPVRTSVKQPKIFRLPLTLHRTSPSGALPVGMSVKQPKIFRLQSLCLSVPLL